MHTEEEVSNKPAEERVIEKEIEQNANQEIIDIQAEEVLPALYFLIYTLAVFNIHYNCRKVQL